MFISFVAHVVVVVVVVASFVTFVVLAVSFLFAALGVCAAGALLHVVVAALAITKKGI